MIVDHERDAKDIVGRSVYTQDGAKLGSVKEVRGSCFRVQPALSADLWLSTDSIHSVKGSQVTVAFDRDHLGDHTVDTPGA